MMPSNKARRSTFRLLYRGIFLLGLVFLYFSWNVSLKVHPKQNGESSFAISSFIGQSIGSHPQLSTQKPVFIIHLGPPKTGTTFLQTSLCSTEGPGFFLRQDNWAFLGTCPRPKKGVMGHSIRAFFQDLPSTKLRRAFVAKVLRHSRMRSNVLLIFEGFWRLTDGQILKLQQLLQPQFHVQVIAAYRPLYEYLPSKYNSISKPPRNPSVRAWPGELTLTTNITGRVLLPFDLHNRGNFTKEFVKPIEESKLHIAHSSLLHFQKKGFRGKVIDFKASSRYLKGGMMEDLICNLLNATYSCNALRTGAWKPDGSKNPSVSFDGDIIAVAAHGAGLIPSNVSRKDAKRFCGSFYDRITSQLQANHTKDMWPVKCLPNETLNHLFELSWETHCNLFCSTMADRQLELQRHLDGFQRSRPKFCYADAERIVQDPEFVSYAKHEIQKIRDTVKDDIQIPDPQKQSGSVQKKQMMKRSKQMTHHIMRARYRKSQRKKETET